jgi:hypothetical protein
VYLGSIERHPNNMLKNYTYRVETKTLLYIFAKRGKEAKNNAILIFFFFGGGGKKMV